jgi:hypothetical protein
MSTRASTLVDSEDIETTKSEKLLAVVLAVFMLIGGIWTYQRIDDYVADALAPTEVQLSGEEQAAISRNGEAQNRLFGAQERLRAARAELEFTREAYNTALNAGEATPALERDYRAAQERFEAAEANVNAARAEVRRTAPAARAAFAREGRLQQERFDRHELVAALLRLAFVSALIAAGYWLLGRLRRQRSRYLPLGLAFVGFATVLAVVMAGDYLTDYVDPRDFGPLILALFGIGATIAAFAALQRYLARRIPIRRVRKQECPFCGYPVRRGEHCEGCGRAVMAECAHCSQPRRVGTVHCAACGRA